MLGAESWSFMICTITYAILPHQIQLSSRTRLLGFTVSIQQWFSTYSPCPSSISITLDGNLLEMQIPRPLTYTCWIRNSAFEPRNLCCNKTSRWFWNKLKFENHWYAASRSKARGIVYSILIWNEDIQLKNNLLTTPTLKPMCFMFMS